MATRLGFDRLFRSLARLTPLSLGLGYAGSLAVGTAVYYLASINRREFLLLLGALVALVAVSVVLTLVTWYQHDPVVRGAFFLGTTTPIGKLIGFSVAALFGVRSGGGTLLATGSFFGIPIAILLSTIVFAILISLGRRFRGTVGPENV